MAARDELQARIDTLLREDPEEPRHGYSEYADPAADVVAALWTAADRADNAETAVSRALDTAEAASAGGNLHRVRHAVQIFVTHHPRAAELGLVVPSLTERAPHLTWPKERDKP